MRTLALTIMLLMLAPSAIAQPKSVLIEDLTSNEVRDAIAAGKTTAIYYAGGIHQNGEAVALGKHLFLAHYIAQRAAEELGNALVLPIMPFAPAGDLIQRTGQMRFPGTLSLSEETFGLVTREVALSAIAAGFKNVAIMGDHGGGQETLKRVASELDSAWASQGVHVGYISDAYHKSEEQFREYLAQRNVPRNRTTAIDDASEVWFVDKDGKWVRQDKLAKEVVPPSAELGKIFVGNKINNVVAQVRSLTGGK